MISLGYKNLPCQTTAHYLTGCQDDIHHATLTVGQTRKFALSIKTPAKRQPNQTKKHFEEQILDVLLGLLGIAHTKDTCK